MMKAVFATAILTHYRAPFHERVRDLLAQEGLEYHVVYGHPLPHEAAKADTVDLPWATKVRTRALTIRGKALLWLTLRPHLLGADLVILGQENRLLSNYPLQMMPRRLRPKVALFGHGRNFQSRRPQALGERWKRLWATRCDWWFAYTEQTGRHIASLGFPPERITVFNNAVDTTALRLQASQVTSERLAARRAELGLRGSNVCVYVGGLYPDKRLDFLVEAADRVRASVKDFELLIIGSGPSKGELQKLVATRPWVKLAGPRFGTDKAELMLLGKLFLMPGALGLAILDAGVCGLPTITTAFPYHGPEIAYLQDGSNGLRVEDWQSPTAYAEAVANLLRDPERLSEMAVSARDIASLYTIEAMARRFADGVKSALMSE